MNSPFRVFQSGKGTFVSQVYDPSNTQKPVYEVSTEGEGKYSEENFNSLEQAIAHGQKLLEQNSTLKYYVIKDGFVDETILDKAVQEELEKIQDEKDKRRNVVASYLVFLLTAFLVFDIFYHLLKHHIYEAVVIALVWSGFQTLAFFIQPNFGEKCMILLINLFLIAMLHKYLW